MGDVTCTVEGLDDLERLLKQLAPAQAKLALRRAEKKAAAVFQDEIERLAPKDTGFLEEHITIRSKVGAGNESGTGSVTVTVGPSKEMYPQGNRKNNRDAAEIARFAEFGTIHEAARPFIGPAFENKKEEVLDTFKTELSAAIEKLTK
jgi:HK97 gp10 family phage protein